jgi:hypothetical protein
MKSCTFIHLVCNLVWKNVRLVFTSYFLLNFIVRLIQISLFYKRRFIYNFINYYNLSLICREGKIYDTSDEEAVHAYGI